MFVAPSLFAQAPSQVQPAAGALPAGYVGSDTCMGCHEQVFNTAFERTPHARIGVLKKKWQGMACEACHGPGAKHAETTSPADIINPAKLKPAALADVCLKCHQTSPLMARWVSGPHSVNQVTCIACHKIHQGPELLRPRKASVINARCASCHTSVIAEFQKPYRHPIPDGVMSCVDCHNPHGRLDGKMNVQLVAGNEPVCFRCHVNLRGPFAFEHAPVKLEGCRACHMPHGSVNPRLLTRSNVYNLCLECHSSVTIPVRTDINPKNATAIDVLGGIPPSFHNITQARFQNCNICHIKIHGSNVDPILEL